MKNLTHILKCKKCNSYALKELCDCGQKRERVIPAKYSPEDKYAKYRRKYKEENVEN